LGLYVVREIATAHGGSVDVSSDAAATRFELRLPRHCVRQP
jgi:signal transduction histidine kinase